MLPQSTTPFQPPTLLNGINGVSLRIGTSAIHMPGSIEYLQVDNTVTSVGNRIGPGTSASRWQKYALAILCWQQLTCTVSGPGTRPSAHTVMALKKHLVLQCPAHNQARRDTWPGDSFKTDPRRLWSYLERSPAPSPWPGMRECGSSRCNSSSSISALDCASVFSSWHLWLEAYGSGICHVSCHKFAFGHWLRLRYSEKN